MGASAFATTHLTSATGGRASRWSWPGSRYGLAAAGLALLCGVQVAVLRGEGEWANTIGYGCYAVVLLACAAACRPCLRGQTGTMRARWTLFYAGLMLAGIDLTLVFIQHMGAIPIWFGQPNTVALNHVSEALLLLAATSFFSGTTRGTAMVDGVQAMLFVMLRFSLTWAPERADHFNTHHLLTAQLVALFLFAVAAVASLGAASAGERRFLRLLALFLGLRFVGYFFADQVSYVWLHYQLASVWDMPQTLLYGCFAIYLWRDRTMSSRLTMAPLGVRPTAAVRNLMPSLLALANLSLGLGLLGRSVRLGAAAALIASAAYAVRTVLVQNDTARRNAALHQRNEQLETLAMRDALTGLGNRRSLEAAYARLRQAPAMDGVGLLLLDVDCFKEANDRFGHVYGDRVLVALARSLEEVAAMVPGSLCVRFGGDEFAMLLPGVQRAEVLALAVDLQRTFAGRDVHGEGRVTTLSVGCAVVYDDDDMTLEAFVRRTDEALYRAKLRGRNRVEVDWTGYGAGDRAVERPEAFALSRAS